MRPFRWRDGVQVLKQLLKVVEGEGDAQSLAVACHDVGCFIQYFPAGKGIVTGVFTHSLSHLYADPLYLDVVPELYSCQGPSWSQKPFLQTCHSSRHSNMTACSYYYCQNSKLPDGPVQVAYLGVVSCRFHERGFSCTSCTWLGFVRLLHRGFMSAMLFMSAALFQACKLREKEYM